MFYIQTSTDGGKSFDTAEKTFRRDYAFQAFVRLSDPEGSRVRMFKDNHLMLTTHLEDAQAELDKLAVKA